MSANWLTTTSELALPKGRAAASPSRQSILGLSSRCDRQHPLIEIKADNLTVLSDTPEGLACENAGPAANVEDSVTRPDPSGVGNRTSPSTEDRRHETGLVDLCSVR
jgi:hypothetical protein